MFGVVGVSFGRFTKCQRSDFCFWRVREAKLNGQMYGAKKVRPSQVGLNSELAPILKIDKVRAFWNSAPATDFGGGAAEKSQHRDFFFPYFGSEKRKKGKAKRGKCCRRVAPAASAEGASIAGRAPQARGCSITRRGKQQNKKKGEKKAAGAQRLLRAPKARALRAERRRCEDVQSPAG